MPRSVWMLLKQSAIVFQKDLHLEFRTRYALNAIAMFAIITLTAVGFSIGPTRLSAVVQAPLLWIVLYFSAISGLSHVFIREEEQQTADTLRLALEPNAIYIGKWFFNVVLLFGLEIIIIPLFFIMMNARAESLEIFFPVVIIGSLGLVSVASFIAAIISLASTRGALFAVLAFPIALPILIAAIHGTRLAFEGAPFSDCLNDLKSLFSFTVIIITVSLLLFEFVWRK
ncbi:MAG: heme exporter protein CcmB [Calditrichaeota bacterium]|nr:heme exporter protein CcmB [Calditrichota bacterium]MCB0289034.1 heme exporter protein CcmB [Calditrichota bacterium]MCB0303660.1 heme exporter protein CcmB [Calditrichota bacterium]